MSTASTGASVQHLTTRATNIAFKQVPRLFRAHKSAGWDGVHQTEPRTRGAIGLIPPRRRVVVSATAAPPVESVSAFEELASSTGPQYVMISGKGGVGKTSLAASLGVRFAERGLRCLVVSTDPAHSLGDSFAQDLAGGVPVRIDGAPNSALWGLEIDPEKEKARFKAYAATSGKQDMKDALGGFGLGGVVDQLADLKLGELLDTPPPGFDEAVAIAKVQELVSKSDEKWDRIVFDTAPTGHTLRLLTVPDFVEASLQKIVTLRRKLTSASSTIKSVFGAGGEPAGALDKLEEVQASIRMVKNLFHDQKNTEFVIATIPTVLGLNESARLIRALRRENIPCKRIVVNQLLKPSMGAKYLEMKEKDQGRALALIDEDPDLCSLRKLTVPYIDRETRGVPALQYFGQLLWASVLDEFNSGSERKYFMLGGKGGVGKTTSAASLGIALGMSAPTGAALVISTDPAHSLSDALDQDVSGGRPVEIQGTDGRVYGLELDLEDAKQELRALGGKDEGRALDRVLSSVGLGAVASQLEDLRLGELLETPPPGIDEAIAISKVIQLLKDPQYSNFTRVVFDTAPTGHTLRLLALPDFLDTSVGKILALQQKLSSITSSITRKVTSFASGGGGDAEEAPSSFDTFKENVAEVQRIFRNPESTSFIVVCIATAMAVAESARLVRTLRREHVPVQAMVLNQVIKPDTTNTFLEQRFKDQQSAMQLLRTDPELAALQLNEAPLLELEVRGVPALQYFGSIVWQD